MLQQVVKNRFIYLQTMESTTTTLLMILILLIVGLTEISTSVRMQNIFYLLNIKELGSQVMATYMTT